MDEAAIAAARAAAAGRVDEDRCEFRAARMTSAGEVDALPAASFDAAICLGATHAFGDGDAAYPNALDELARLVRPGGQLLLGEGYWKQPPSAGYLELLGDPPGITHDHAGNIAFAEARGLVPLYAAVSSDDEWDHFEWSHRMKVEHEAARHPDDPALAEKRERSRVWRDGYLRWGRSTMGFGFYLFMKRA
jgi:SAM-dependent methyltransferase